MSGVSFPFVTPGAGIRVFNDAFFDHLEAGVETVERGFGLPRLVNTSAFTDYQEIGWLAYDSANGVPMFSNGVIWQDLSAGLVIHDSTLTGNGTAGSPLGLAPQSVTPATYYNPVVAVDGVGVITSITSTNPLIANWMTSTSVAGGGTTANITAASLDANYNNETPANLNPATGVYTCTQPGHYLVTASVDSETSGVGDFIGQVTIALTNSKAAAKIVGWTNNPALAGGTSRPQYSVNAVVSLAAGDTVWAQVQGGSSTVDYNAHVSMAYFNGPFV